MRTTWAIFVLTALLAAASLVWAAVAGPDPFPTHFTGAGVADSWAPRDHAVAIFAAIELGA